MHNLVEFYNQADAEGAAWRDLIARWVEHHGYQEVSTADVWNLVNPADGGDSLDLGLGDQSDRSQKTRLGKLLYARRDQRFGDLQLVPTRKKQGAAMWRLVQTL